MFYENHLLTRYHLEYARNGKVPVSEEEEAEEEATQTQGVIAHRPWTNPAASTMESWETPLPRAPGVTLVERSSASSRGPFFPYVSESHMLLDQVFMLHETRREMMRDILRVVKGNGFCPDDLPSNRSFEERRFLTPLPIETRANGPPSVNVCDWANRLPCNEYVMSRMRFECDMTDAICGPLDGKVFRSSRRMNTLTVQVGNETYRTGDFVEVRHSGRGKPYKAIITSVHNREHNGEKSPMVDVQYFYEAKAESLYHFFGYEGQEKNVALVLSENPDHYVCDLDPRVLLGKITVLKKFDLTTPADFFCEKVFDDSLPVTDPEHLRPWHGPLHRDDYDPPSPPAGFTGPVVSLMLEGFSDGFAGMKWSTKRGSTRSLRWGLANLDFDGHMEWPSDVLCVDSLHGLTSCLNVFMEGFRVLQEGYVVFSSYFGCEVFVYGTLLMYRGDSPELHPVCGLNLNTSHNASCRKCDATSDDKFDSAVRRSNRTKIDILAKQAEVRAAFEVNATAGEECKKRTGVRPDDAPMLLAKGEPAEWASFGPMHTSDLGDAKSELDYLVSSLGSKGKAKLDMAMRAFKLPPTWTLAGMECPATHFKVWKANAFARWTQVAPFVCWCLVFDDLTPTGKRYFEGLTAGTGNDALFPVLDLMALQARDFCAHRRKAVPRDELPEMKRNCATTLEAMECVWGPLMKHKANPHAKLHITDQIDALGCIDEGRDENQLLSEKRNMSRTNRANVDLQVLTRSNEVAYVRHALSGGEWKSMDGDFVRAGDGVLQAALNPGAPAYRLLHRVKSHTSRPPSEELWGYGGVEVVVKKSASPMPVGANGLTAEVMTELTKARPPTAYYLGNRVQFPKGRVISKGEDIQLHGGKFATVVGIARAEVTPDNGETCLVAMIQITLWKPTGYADYRNADIVLRGQRRSWRLASDIYNHAHVVHNCRASPFKGIDGVMYAQCELSDNRSKCGKCPEYVVNPFFAAGQYPL